MGIPGKLMVLQGDNCEFSGAVGFRGKA
jgi:hypothetical protein